MNRHVDNNGFLVYETTKEDIELAKKKFNETFIGSDYNLNTKTVYNRKESRLVGILGEVVFQKLYPLAEKSHNSSTYDFILKDRKIDVKCKYRTVEPRLDFEASFFTYQGSDKFDVDLYVFMSTMGDFEKVWICGHIRKERFLKESKLWKAGETDTRNGMKFKKDTYCLPYSGLRRF